MALFQRALRNVLENWPLLLIRLAEGVVLVAVTVGGLVLSMLPLILAIGAHDWRHATPDIVLEALLQEKTALALTVLLLLVVFGGVLLLTVAIHSFVQAATVGVYIDGERRGGRAFTPEAWLAWGRGGWRRLFLLYNFLWGLFGLVLLIPLLLLTIPVLVWYDSPAVLVMTCAALVLILAVAILAGFLAGLWSSVAAVISVRSGTGARESLRLALSLAKRRFGDLVAVVAVRIAAGIMLQAFFSTFWFGLGAMSDVKAFSYALLPFQGAFTAVQIAASMLISAWFLAAIVAVALLPDGRSIDAVRS